MNIRSLRVARCSNDIETIVVGEAEKERQIGRKRRSDKTQWRMLFFLCRNRCGEGEKINKVILRLRLIKFASGENTKTECILEIVV